MLVALCGCGGGGGGGGGTVSPVPAADLNIKVASSPADFVTGGTVLLQIDVSRGTLTSSVEVQVNGRDVSTTFVTQADGRSMLGVLEGLPEGMATVDASATDNDGAIHTGRLSISNMSRTSGVLIKAFQPILCRTEFLGLAAAIDADCNTPHVFTYLYKSSDSSKPSLLPYNLTNPPTDVATTTTDQGVTVPFIVRNERGVIDRFVYDIAVLFDPSKPWTATSPQVGWNHKVLWRFGGGCTPGHVQSSNSPQAVDNAYGTLGRGFAVATSGLSVLGNHCNTILSAEGVLTVKSHLAVTYGSIRYTISDGGSGGAIQQHSIANNYPGLLNGLVITGTSFVDPWILVHEFADCRLLLNYALYTSPNLWSDRAQLASVMGKFNMNTCAVTNTDAFQLGYAFEQVVLDPSIGCTFPDNASPPTFSGSLPSPGIYNAATNPGGIRCTIQDALASVLGRRPSDSFANRPYDNVGVQYGLAALKAGVISKQQFLDLNAKIGGLDIDNNLVPTRTGADVAGIEPLYRSGQIVDGKALADVPIIAYQSYDNETFHDTFHNWSIRARLIDANGDASNQIIWTYRGSPGSLPQVAFDQMDQWLSNIEVDPATDGLQSKLKRSKPGLLRDGCDIAGAAITDMTVCSNTYPNFSNPRIVAGDSVRSDVVKCELKRLDVSDYLPIVFDAAELEALRIVFADGVCNFAKPGVHRAATVPWSVWTSN